MNPNASIATISDVECVNLANEQANARAVIQRHSRSFSIASRLLPQDVRDSVYALYAWCRTVDDAVDEASRDDQAAKVLDLLEDDLDQMRQGQSPQHAASLWIEPLVVQRRIDVVHAKELIEGMRMDLHSYRVNNQDELQRYCYHAAGTVGLMMTRLMGVRDPIADRHAIALGVAMQLTNIARDVREDAERGRSYLPGVANPMTADPAQVRNAVSDLLRTAEQHYAMASAGLHYLPWRCRFAIRLALAFYREIGRRILGNDCQVMRGRTTVSKIRLAGLTAIVFVNSLVEDVKFELSSFPLMRPETPMKESHSAQVSSVAQAKHAVYLGLSLTAIMSAALFVMVYANPKDASYSYLPLVYCGASLVGAFVFNRLAARCEVDQPSVLVDAALQRKT